MTNSTINPKTCPLIVLWGPLLTFSLLGSSTATAGVCMAYNNGNAAEPTIGSAVGLPLFRITDLNYQGAFKFGPDQYGISNVQSSRGSIAVDKGTIFIEGHPYHNAAAQFQIPALVMESSNRDALNVASVNLQPFSRVLDSREGIADTGDLDWLAGLSVIDGALIVNGLNGYDSPPISQETTVIIEDAYDLANSTAVGQLHMDGETRAAGWISPVPLEWQAQFGGDYIAGHSGGNTSINSRHSIGPSAYALDKTDLFAATLESPEIFTQELQQYNFATPIYADYVEGEIRPETTAEVTPNSWNQNPLWTQVTSAHFGMIVPGTSTYLTVGHNQGMEFGVGYKITQDTGRKCNGPCPFIAADVDSYYWLFDVNDWIKVQNGEIEPEDIRPYSYGPLPNVDFLDRQNVNARVGGGAWDASTGTLYISLQGAGYLGNSSNPPVVVAYKFNNLN